MKTSELTGDDLNRAVAMALGHELHLRPPSVFLGVPGWRVRLADHGALQVIPNYAGDIAAAWPIIKEHQIDLLFGRQHSERGLGTVAATYSPVSAEHVAEHSPDPLLAAMRCFVASVLGDEVELP